jgi:methylmalonyl-CoA mutase C-terminal domain/subunit
MVAKIGLDGHDRGIKIIARALRNDGMEVVYLGMRLTREAIVKAAVEEGVDVVGISILSGAHMRLIPKLIDEFKAEGLLGRFTLIVGGTIPEKDAEDLRRMGVDGVFPVGASMGSIISFIRERVRRD